SKDEKTIDAVVRNFEIIGEAANKVDQEIKEVYTQVEWRRIIGLRNRIIHEYFGIDLNIIWVIIEGNLEDFKSQIQGIIDQVK
ncbi:MAG: HepT-like ribonuclease domain-containing protein, partial [Bacteroidota bacterium]